MLQLAKSFKTYVLYEVEKWGFEFPRVSDKCINHIC